MLTKADRNKQRQKRHARVRRTISGTAERPRLNVFRSSKHIYAQLIDDVAGQTIAAASTLDAEIEGNLETTGNIEAAEQVGQLIAKRALDKGHEQVVFDRGGYVYHGRVQALAQAARDGGLKF